jgi:hypothetical protein
MELNDTRSKIRIDQVCLLVSFEEGILLVRYKRTFDGKENV